MNQINLNEEYLHKIVLSSVNKLIKEDTQSVFNYLDDIVGGNVEEMNDNGNDYIEVLINGKSGNMYSIVCDAWSEETQPYHPPHLGLSYDEYEPDESAEYDYNVNIQKIECWNDGFSDWKDITSSISIDDLEMWLKNNLDWSELNSQRSFDQYDEEDDL